MTTTDLEAMLRRVLCAALLVPVLACGGAAAPPGDDVWAVVDGRQIRRDDVELAFRRLTQPNAAPPSDAEALSAKLELVSQLIDQEILLGRAQTLGIAVTDAEVDTAYTERKRNLTDEAFQKELDSRRLTADDMKRGLRRELIVQKLLEQEVSSKVNVGDQEIKEFYEKNRAQFNVPETQYRLAQIVVTPVRDAQIRNRLNDDATTPDDAKKKMQMLADRLRGGADFATLARDYSEDPQSAPQGGDLGFVPLSALNQVPPQLREIVLKTDPGNVSSVAVGGAYTIVFVASRQEAGQRDLGTPAVRDGISNMLRERKLELLRTAYIAAARNDVTVENHLARQVVQAQGSLPGLMPPAPAR
jgi:peptidyl-prolyl cis-trans isomerase SurA